MNEFETGDMVVLDTLPVGLLQGLPEEDQAAIRAIIGRPVMLAGDSFGQAELEFVDGAGDNHSIWVEPSLLRAASRSRCNGGVSAPRVEPIPQIAPLIGIPWAEVRIWMRSWGTDTKVAPPEARLLVEWTTATSRKPDAE